MVAPSLLSEEEINQLVTDNLGWTESIARSVARAWNLDWQSDGLDGAAMEALFFCARRYDGTRGVPFRSYARKRIHEASTEAARKTKNWIKGGHAPDAATTQRARDISAELLNVFPELREGELPAFEDGGDDVRGSIRQLLTGASLIAARKEGEGFESFEEALDAKRMVEILAHLDSVHQLLMFRVYWEGVSMRGVAEEWGLDELNVIREHKTLLAFLNRSIAKGKAIDPPKVRPGLKETALKLSRQDNAKPFTSIREGKGISA